ncbi:hypothetical protein ABT346_27745 [Micromonospora peucetia]|uniref:hypothetical protein n=1 Tax=Micromonospora peucetia TaxID=47871 RepID=UPI00331BB211
MLENTDIGGHGIPRHLCRRTRPEAYRCACGRVRDRCVRATVRALWAPSRRLHTGPARPDDVPGTTVPGDDDGHRRHEAAARFTPADPARP